MTCDEVFDLLTGSETPTGNEFHQHLQQCPECRRMARTLVPAVRLFQEVAADSEQAPSHDSPFALPKLVGSSANSSGNRRTSDRHWSGRSWFGPLGLAAAILIGIIFGSALQMNSSLTLRASMNSQDARAQRTLQTASTPAGMLPLDARIARLGMAQACLAPLAPPPAHPPASSPPKPAHWALADLHCCTFCHTAGKNAVASYVQLQSSCQLCHLARR